MVELGRLERLRDEVGSAESNGTDGPLDVAVRGDHHHLGRRLAAPQRFEHLEPIHLGHFHIQEHELRVEIGHGCERRFAVDGDVYFVPLGTHAIRDDLTDCRVIIDDENARGCHDRAIIQHRT